MERESGLDGELHRQPVQHRQRARHAQADGTDVRVRRRAEAGGTAAEDLGRGGELDVHFQADDRLVFRDRFRQRQIQSSHFNYYI